MDQSIEEFLLDHFLLHNIFSEFVTTKENDIKMLIKQILLIISKEMGLDEYKY